MGNGADEAKKKKLAKLLAEFDGDELSEILSEELDATTRRKIKGTGAVRDPEKDLLFEKLASQINSEDTKKLSEWSKDKTWRSCSITGNAPSNMNDGLGGKFDKMSINFRFSSEAIRKELTDKRNAAIAAENGE